MAIPSGRYIALLRGINVGRAKRVAMADLRQLVEELGYRDVRTILNSGNVVFSGGREAPVRAAARIERGLRERLGLSAAVTALRASELATAVGENALTDTASDPARLLVAFSPDRARLVALRALTRQQWSPEALAVGTVAAYLWCPAGIIGSALAAAVGRALGASATMRNWATVEKILSAVEPARGSWR